MIRIQGIASGRTAHPGRAAAGSRGGTAPRGCAPSRGTSCRCRPRCRRPTAGGCAARGRRATGAPAPPPGSAACPHLGGTNGRFGQGSRGGNEASPSPSPPKKQQELPIMLLHTNTRMLTFLNYIHYFPSCVVLIINDHFLLICGKHCYDDNMTHSIIL